MELGQRLQELLDTAVANSIFPGAVAAVALKKENGWRRVIVKAGDRMVRPVRKEMREDTVFDLASLTKPLATTLAFLCLLREGKIGLCDSLTDIFGSCVPVDKSAVTMAMLLGHCSGLPAWQPYFEYLVKVEMERRRNEMFQRILGEELRAAPGTAEVYSDLGFLLLGWAVEQRVKEPLDVFVEKNVFESVGLGNDLFFQPLSRRHSARFAAGEDCPWRKKIVIGEVGDDNAHVLGGVAGHAGLFGTASGVLSLAVLLLDIWKGRGNHPRIAAEDMRFFLENRPCSASNRVYGFDRPEKEDSSAGRYFSPSSVGHLGYSGTSFWIDPERELVAVLLTNRVHPSRGNEAIKDFRPVFHDALAEFCLDGRQRSSGIRDTGGE